MEIGTNYWYVDWGRGQADPFKDGYQNVRGPDPWKPEFLEETGLYTVHRFMDFNRTNDSEQRHWPDRAQKGNLNQATVAYEWMIDLCNRHKADAWINLPHLTFEDQAYWTSLAELMLAELDPTLKLYIEYSNETWNTMFDQATYCQNKGSELGLDEGQYKAGFEFHVYAAVRMFEHFEAVWGAGGSRLVKVIAGQAANTWITGVHLEALNDSTINPRNTRPTVYGIAPYFGNGAASVEEAFQAIPTGVDRARRQSEALEGSGLPLVGYEGGQHLLENAQTVNRDPRMYDVYRTYLRGIAPYLSVFAHYTHTSRYSDRNAWGAKDDIGQADAQSPKYRALRDFAGATPEPVEETLVSFDDLWRFSSVPSYGWATPEFDDGAWEMQENHEESAVYLRKEFVSNLRSADKLQLTVRHDKGFVAYLNGTEILSVAAGATARTYQLDQHAHLLREGNNVLAIQLHVDDYDKTDLSMNPELTASGEAG